MNRLYAATKVKNKLIWTRNEKIMIIPGQVILLSFKFSIKANKKVLPYFYSNFAGTFITKRSVIR
jgi:hypothetical protein